MSRLKSSLGKILAILSYSRNEEFLSEFLYQNLLLLVTATRAGLSRTVALIWRFGRCITLPPFWLVDRWICALGKFIF